MTAITLALKLFCNLTIAQSPSVKVGHMLLWYAIEGFWPRRGRHGLVARAGFTPGPRRLVVFQEIRRSYRGHHAVYEPRQPDPSGGGECV